MPRGDLEIVVIGAGMSGLAAAQKLRERGFTPKILEKAHEVGGTWRDNKYPGLYVDLPVSVYQMLFAPRYDWSRACAPGPEIQAYLKRCYDELDLRKHITFGVDISAAEWVDGRWVLTTTTGETHTADAVVAATGYLHRKKKPRIDGMETFEGRQFHSAEWPDDLDMQGKRIAVVGSGASGIQILCALGEMGVQVTQYVRTPQWIETLKNPEASRLRRLVGRLFPKIGQRLQAKLVEGNEQDPRLRDPAWKLKQGPKRETAQQALREMLEVIRDPDLREALRPDFNPGCKRIPKSPTYYQTVQLPNVRIIRSGVDKVAPKGIVAPDGSVDEYDVIVWATGFDAHAYVRPMQVKGLDGATLDEMWGDNDVFSYRGVAVPNLPNFFLLLGPFSPANNVPIPLTVNDEMDWICEVLAETVDKLCAFAPSQAATEEFVSWVGEAIPQTVWADGCVNYYQDGKGLPVLWPWSYEEHTEMFSDVRLDRLDPVPCRLGVSASDGNR